MRSVSPTGLNSAEIHSASHATFSPRTSPPVRSRLALRRCPKAPTGLRCLLLPRSRLPFSRGETCEVPDHRGRFGFVLSRLRRWRRHIAHALRLGAWRAERNAHAVFDVDAECTGSSHDRDPRAPGTVLDRASLALRLECYQLVD